VRVHLVETKVIRVKKAGIGRRNLYQWGTKGGWHKKEKATDSNRGKLSKDWKGKLSPKRKSLGTKEKYQGQNEMSRRVHQSGVEESSTLRQKTGE